MGVSGMAGMGREAVKPLPGLKVDDSNIAIVSRCSSVKHVALRVHRRLIAFCAGRLRGRHAFSRSNAAHAGRWRRIVRTKAAANDQLWAEAELPVGVESGLYLTPR